MELKNAVVLEARGERAKRLGRVNGPFMAASQALDFLRGDVEDNSHEWADVRTVAAVATDGTTAATWAPHIAAKIAESEQPDLFEPTAATPQPPPPAPEHAHARAMRPQSTVYPGHMSPGWDDPSPYRGGGYGGLGMALQFAKDASQLGRISDPRADAAVKEAAELRAELRSVGADHAREVRAIQQEHRREIRELETEHREEIRRARETSFEEGKEAALRTQEADGPSTAEQWTPAIMAAVQELSKMRGDAAPAPTTPPAQRLSPELRRTVEDLARAPDLMEWVDAQREAIAGTYEPTEEDPQGETRAQDAMMGMVPTLSAAVPILKASDWWEWLSDEERGRMENAAFWLQKIG